MKIIKELKFGEFEYDSELKQFQVTIKNKETEEAQTISFSKAYSFSLMRFMVRIAQKNFKKNKKNIDNIQKKVLSSKNNQKQLEIKI